MNIEKALPTIALLCIAFIATYISYNVRHKEELVVHDVVKVENVQPITTKAVKEKQSTVIYANLSDLYFKAYLLGFKHGMNYEAGIDTSTQVTMDYELIGRIKNN